ncbi:hypothetical protein AB6E04_10275 [Vibrio amylolyticus]
MTTCKEYQGTNNKERGLVCTATGKHADDKDKYPLNTTKPDAS